LQSSVPRGGWVPSAVVDADPYNYCLPPLTFYTWNLPPQDDAIFSRESVTVEELEQFFEEHDPSELAHVERWLEAYRHAELKDVLRRKYGAVPGLEQWEQLVPSEMADAEAAGTEAAREQGGGGGAGVRVPAREARVVIELPRVRRQTAVEFDLRMTETELLQANQQLEPNLAREISQLADDDNSGNNSGTVSGSMGSTRMFSSLRSMAGKSMSIGRMAGGSKGKLDSRAGSADAILMIERNGGIIGSPLPPTTHEPSLDSDVDEDEERQRASSVLSI
jgi:hypothetical protein